MPCSAGASEGSTWSTQHAVQEYGNQDPHAVCAPIFGRGRQHQQPFIFTGILFIFMYLLLNTSQSGVQDWPPGVPGPSLVYFVLSLPACVHTATESTTST